jgi:thiamine biosynthesis lipoprotein ApbE
MSIITNVKQLFKNTTETTNSELEEPKKTVKKVKLKKQKSLFKVNNVKYIVEKELNKDSLIEAILNYRKGVIPTSGDYEEYLRSQSSISLQSIYDHWKQIMNRDKMSKI